MARFLPGNGLPGRMCQKWPIPYPVMGLRARMSPKWPIRLCKWPQECDVSASGAQDERPNWQPGSCCCCWLSWWGWQEKMGHIAIEALLCSKEILLQQGVCHTVALPFTLKSILMQKKNYGHSNISPCKNILIFKKKSSKRNQNPSRYYYNSVTNLKFQHEPKYYIFQKSSYKTRPIIIT
jgi:hypothetical protein